MKVVIADCSAIYTGRGDTTLSRGVRSLLLKRDGSVSIHNDKSNKPLNYMKEAVFFESTDTSGNQVWTFDSRRESLSITMYSILMSAEMPLIEDDPGLVHDGTEDHLQEWLADHPEVLGKGFSLVKREFPTGKGPVDLLIRDENNVPIAVEVKRVAMLGAVDQCRRYVDSLKDPAQQEELNELGYDLDYSSTYGMIAGVDIRPKTLDWAEKKSIIPVFVDPLWRDKRDEENGTSESPLS